MNKKELRELREKVAAKMRGKAYSGLIGWEGSVVKIQDILLDNPPSEYHAGPLKIRLKRAAYRKILDNWKKNFIGGKKEFHGQESLCDWRPPAGSKIYQIRTGFPAPTNESFYILYLKDGRHVFLQKLRLDEHDKHDLLVIEGWEDEVAGQLFERALKNALEAEEEED